MSTHVRSSIFVQCKGSISSLVATVFIRSGLFKQFDPCSGMKIWYRSELFDTLMVLTKVPWEKSSCKKTYYDDNNVSLAHEDSNMSITMESIYEA